jgi:hypothetical protein
MIRRRSIRNLLAAGFMLVAGLGLLRCTAAAPHAAADNLPARIGDDAFWRMISEFSEPGGYFRSDNFLSNENAFQVVVPQLSRNERPGGVYLGVGPEQNFTYLVALQPKVAFIIDIRRQNMLEHLLYKALIERSANRIEFLSRLFSRRPPPDLGGNPSVEALFEAYEHARPAGELFQENLQAVTDQLVTHHRFNLSSDDLKSIEYVYRAFYDGGPDLNYSFLSGGRGGWGWFPTYAQLMTETDGRGAHRSYLATEENFRILRDLEGNNVIVPLVGDFAGPKAIRAVGRYLKEHGATVTAFYTSNVEQYLFQQDDDWRKFFSNVATLPIDGNSTFIRSVSNRGFQYQSSGAGRRAMPRLGAIADLLKAFNGGRLSGYSDVIAMSR